MVTLDCAASRHDGVTLVTVHLRELEVPTRVTVRNRLDGPVWPPRSEGLPEAGWTDTGFAGVLGPGSHALGYATPAPPDDPPAVLADAAAVPGADPIGESTDGPADVVRELGDPSPPGDAVPAADADGRESLHAGVSAPSSPGPTAEEHGNGLGTVPDDGRGGSPAPATAEPDASRDDGAGLPTAVGPWMAEMARRVDTAEALAGAETVPEATAAVREAGGLAEVSALAEASDERRLRLVARRARRLAERRSEADIPVETLSRLS